MSIVTGHPLSTASDRIDGTEVLVRVGRAALITQGVLYAVVGLLAAQVADGDRRAQPSQRGAIARVAAEPFGRVLLAVLAGGLVAHVAWRGTLAVRGEPGSGEDGSSIAKRIANAGRAAVYASFAFAAIRILMHSGGGQGSQAQRKSTAVVLGWPGGRVLVAGAGLAVVGAALWNLRKAFTRSFLEHLDLSGLDERPRRAVAVTGSVGYAARAWAFGLVGWFLMKAGLQRNARQTAGLDGSLRRLAATHHGALLLGILAVGLVLFGAFRILDGWYRKPSEITYA